MASVERRNPTRLLVSAEDTDEDEVECEVEGVAVSEVIRVVKEASPSEVVKVVVENVLVVFVSLLGSTVAARELIDPSSVA